MNTLSNFTIVVDYPLIADCSLSAMDAAAPTAAS
jgi:hypothetical protein